MGNKHNFSFKTFFKHLVMEFSMDEIPEFHCLKSKDNSCDKVLETAERRNIEEGPKSPAWVHGTHDFSVSPT